MVFYIKKYDEYRKIQKLDGGYQENLYSLVDNTEFSVLKYPEARSK